MEHDAVVHVADACDGITLVVCLGVSAGHKHDAHRRAGVNLQCATVEVARSHTFEKVHQVALDAQHHAFGLGVAHADVVFDDHRVAAHVNQAEEDKAFVVDALGGQSLHGGADDAVFHLPHPCLVGKGDGRHGTHAAGVQSFVALAYALVVLRFGQYLVILAVGEHEHRALYAAEELLDDHFGRCLAEHAVEHLAQLALGLVERGHDEHALAGAESVGLEHIGGLQGLKEGAAFIHAVGREAAVARRGDAVAFHEALGKLLAAFEHRSGF